MALGPLWTLNIVVALGSAALLAGVVWVYARNVRSIRSPFTLGLLLFGAVLLAQSLLALFVYVSMNDQGMGPGVAIPMLALNVTGLAALASLFVVTWR